jgi:hypothetical protein
MGRHRVPSLTSPEWTLDWTRLQRTLGLWMPEISQGGTASRGSRPVTRPNEKVPCRKKTFEAEWKKGMTRQRESLRAPKRQL